MAAIDTLAAPEADRLAPPPDEVPRQYLRLGVGGEMLAVGIELVREILEVGRMTPLPQTPAFVRGVMNLRGAVMPVIDVQARFGQPITDVGRRTCIVVVEVHAAASADNDDGHDHDQTHAEAGHVVGMLVDAVYEVFEAADRDLEPVPVMGTSVPPEHLHAMARVRGQVCAVLDIHRLLAPATLADLIASQLALS